MARFVRGGFERLHLRSSALLALVLMASLLVVSPATAVPSGFITRQGTELLLNGNPYRFSGLNIFNANSDGYCGAQMDQGTRLDDALTSIGQVEVIRSWFFQPLAINKGTGLRDWSAFDHTLQVADAHGKKVIATLTDQWGECGSNVAGNGYKDADWYVNGYQQVQPGMLVSYRDWVAEMVTRYKDDPRIAFWQLINEAEVTPCPAGDLQPYQKLHAWAADVSGLVKSIDSNHLVSLGTIGSGQCGADGPRYQDLHAIPTIDLCEYHDYGAPNVGVPGDEFNGLQVRINQCNALNKPLFVGEAGIIPNEVGGTFQARADAFQVKLDAQFSAGVQGFLAWAWSPQEVPVSTLNNYDIGPGDPSLAVLADGPDEDLTWTKTFLDPQAEAGDFLGFSVDFYGSDIVAGAPSEDTGAPNAGSVFVFVPNGALRLALRNPDPGTLDTFGASVASVGSYIAVGAPLDDASASDAGAVYLFDGSNGALLRTILDPDPAAGDQFGTTVSAAGGKLVVGAPYDDLPGVADGGSVFVFDPVTGNLVHSIPNPFPTMDVVDPDTGALTTVPRPDRFGLALAPSGTEGLLVGAPQENASATLGVGRVYLYDVSSGDLLQTYERPRGGNDDQGFGYSVARIGSNLVVGAPFAGDFSGNVFLLDGTTGAELRIWNDPTFPHSGEKFGYTVAASRGRVVVGTPDDDTGNPGNRGGLYLFDPASGAFLQEVNSPTPNQDAQLGSSLATRGTMVLSGAPGDNLAAEDAGAAYLFNSGVTPNAPPDVAGLGQFEANGTTSIPVGATTDGTSVVFKATVSDPDGGQVRLQVEVEPVGTPFDGNGLVTGAPVSSGSVATASVSGLARAKGCHWRARALDEADAPSQNWVSFGANVETDRDFVVEAPIVFSSTRHGSNNANQQEIYSMAPDGSNPTRLTFNTKVDTDPSLSPDGSKIAFQSDRDGDNEIFVMNVDGTGVAAQLTTNAAADQAPAWSPDGTKIAFVSNRITQNNYDVWTMNANGSNPVRLTTIVSTDNYPTWSPDGTKIAFVSPRDGDEEILVMNANGSTQLPITSNNRRDTFPAWSPDGTKIAFSSNRDGVNNFEIYAMNVDGSSVLRLTNKPRDDMAPAWSRSGARIAFQGVDTDLDWEIYRMPAPGGLLTKLTLNARTDVAPGW